MTKQTATKSPVSKRVQALRKDLEALVSHQPARQASRQPVSIASHASAIEESHDQQHGREADHPTEIPRRGWFDLMWRTWGEISEANLFLVAGGVTYAILLALFPGLAALVSLYGLALNPAQVEQQVAELSGVLPEQSRQMLADELHKLVSASGGALGVSAVVGLLLALWSASRGMSGFITALNITYEEKEKRGFFKLNLIAIGLTVALLLGGTFIIALIGVLPVALQFAGLGQQTKWILLILEWPLLVVVVMVGLAALYRYAPSRDEAKWRWVSPGAIAATVLWVIASAAFSVYVANFNSYDKTYGSLGGVIILLTWLYLSAFIVLLGAAINAQLEKQTKKDSTVGPPDSMGRRGAKAADTLGPTK
jgi:membrane protein